MGEKHVAVDIGGIHGLDFFDRKLVEGLWGTNGKTGLFSAWSVCHPAILVGALVGCLHY